MFFNTQIVLAARRKGGTSESINGGDFLVWFLYTNRSQQKSTIHRSHLIIIPYFFFLHLYEKWVDWTPLHAFSSWRLLFFWVCFLWNGQTVVQIWFYFLPENSHLSWSCFLPKKRNNFVESHPHVRPWMRTVRRSYA